MTTPFDAEWLEYDDDYRPAPTFTPPQGWECPRCRIVWSPYQPKCECAAEAVVIIQVGDNDGPEAPA